MKKIIKYIKKSGIKENYSDELKQNIQVSNIFIIIYIFLTVPFIILFRNSFYAILVTTFPMILHITSFILIKFNLHKIGRFVFSITSAIFTFIIGTLLYIDDGTDGMVVKFIIIGSIILPFIVFKTNERILTFISLLIHIVLILIFNIVNNLVSFNLVQNNFDTPEIRIVAICISFTMLSGVLFFYKKQLMEKNRKLKETNIKVKETNDELTAIEEELRQNNEELTIINENNELQKEKIEIAHKKINQSINYAKTIQDALLTSSKLIDKYFNDYFLFFKPKEQVGGDFIM